jgi:hypothetical protein
MDYQTCGVEGFMLMLLEHVDIADGTTKNATGTFQWTKFHEIL